ncbi:MAG: hypothetical protein ABFD91_17800 [Anaerohalosphaeraceae bacterium]
MKQKYRITWKMVLALIGLCTVSGFGGAYWAFEKQICSAQSISISFGITWIGCCVFLVLVKCLADRENKAKDE